MEEENFSLDFSSLLTVEEEKESAGSSPQTNKDAGKLETNKEDVGKLEYGCEHYRRRCKIRAPCCDEIFACRHCHNDAVSLQKNPKDHHELVRRDVKQVICSLCNTEQPVAQICSNCGVKMGEYFCNICKFYDDDTRKGQFHCDDCGICRVGGRDEFFHCKKCGSCYTVTVLNKHVCVEQSMKNNCPICYEYLFDSIKGSIVMNCGHTMHSDCLDEMAKQNLYRCPICSKTVLNMSDYWQRLDMEKFLCANPKAQTCSKNLEQHNNLLHCCPQVTGLDLDLLPNELKWLDLEKPHHFSFLEFKQIEANKLHEEYQFDVSILCNDCNGTSKAPFHIFGHKCRRCNSYNTRRIATPCDEGNAN